MKVREIRVVLLLRVVTFFRDLVVVCNLFDLDLLAERNRLYTRKSFLLIIKSRSPSGVSKCF